jgi:hypothetical protein
MHTRERIISSINDARKTGAPCVEQTRFCLSSKTKLNSKWIKNVNLRPQSMKLLEENTGEALQDIEWSKDFLDTILPVLPPSSLLFLLF